MPIEFRCTQCNSLLRVPDGSVGRDARCPQCQAIVSVPALSDAPLSPPQAAPPEPLQPQPVEPAVFAPPPAASVTNPFQSPTSDGQLPTTSTGVQPLQPTIIEIGQVLDRAWAVFKIHWPKVLVAFWGPVLVYWIVLSVVAIGFTALSFALGHNNDGPEMVPYFLFVVVSIGWLLVTIFTLMIKAARGMEISARDLLGTPSRILPGVAVLLLVSLAVGVGGTLIIPGIILGLMFSQGMNVVADRGLGPIEALRVSAQVTKGNWLTLLLLHFMVSTLCLLGMLVTCGLGAVIALPAYAFVQAIIYLELTGQKLSSLGPDRERAFV